MIMWKTRLKPNRFKDPELNKETLFYIYSRPVVENCTRNRDNIRFTVFGRLHRQNYSWKQLRLPLHF